MGKIKEFFDSITEDNVEDFCVGAILFGVAAIVYSIVAGIWGFAPLERINVKIFGTAVVIIIIFGLILYVIQDGKNENK